MFRVEAATRGFHGWRVITDQGVLWGLFTHLEDAKAAAISGPHIQARMQSYRTQAQAKETDEQAKGRELNA